MGWIDDQIDRGKEWLSDRGDDAKDAGEKASDAVVPDWASELGNAEILGYSLLENPGGYVIAAVIDWFVTGILSFANAIAIMLWRTWLILASVFLDVLIPLLEAFAAIGDVFVSTTAEGEPAGVINIINAQIVDVAATAGPAAPFVATALWAALVIGIAYFIRAQIEVLKWA